MNSIDIESKKFLGQPKNFVSIFNALLFDGQPVLKSEYLKDENSELIMNVSSNHVDIIKRYEDGTYLDLFVIESQRCHNLLVFNVMYLFNLQNYAFIFTLPNFLLTFC